MTEYAEEIERGGKVYRQVAKNHFYSAIKDYDVHPRIQNSHWPYESHWMSPPASVNSSCIGVSIGRDVYSTADDSSYVYYLRKDRL